MSALLLTEDDNESLMERASEVWVSPDTSTLAAPLYFSRKVMHI